MNEVERLREVNRYLKNDFLKMAEFVMELSRGDDIDYQNYEKMLNHYGYVLTEDGHIEEKD